MIGKVFYSLLSSVGTVYPVRAKQGQNAPYIVYNKISDRPTDTKSGVSRLDVDRVQVDYYASTYSACVTMADAGRTALDRYSGTIETVVVDKIVFENEMDMYDNDAELYRRSQDYFIRIKL